MPPRTNFKRKQKPLSLTLEQISIDYENELGSGSFAKVYKGELRGKPVAVKVLKSVTNVISVAQYKAETKYLSMLEHENIVKLIGYEEEMENKFLVLEHLPEKLDNSAIQALNWEDTMEILRQSAKALSYIHGHSLVLADFKVDNLMLDKNRKVVKLIDFGAMVEQGKMVDVSTIGYAPPEFALEGSTSQTSQTCVATDRSDIYSFGIVIFQLLMKSESVGIPLKLKHRPKFKVKEEKVDVNDEGIHIYQRANCLIKKQNHVVHKDLMEAGVKQGKAEQLSKLALDCTQHIAQARPSIGQVIERLELIRNL